MMLVFCPTSTVKIAIPKIKQHIILRVSTTSHQYSLVLSILVLLQKLLGTDDDCSLPLVVSNIGRDSKDVNQIRLEGKVPSFTFCENTRRVEEEDPFVIERKLPKLFVNGHNRCPQRQFPLLLVSDRVVLVNSLLLRVHLDRLSFTSGFTLTSMTKLPLSVVAVGLRRKFSSRGTLYHTFFFLIRNRPRPAAGFIATMFATMVSTMNSRFLVCPRHIL
mmetsp:Transcript_41073/g.98356  ORF Transcript_41073/g.98356 Transcript_41073/m.98356 type:complete len:218 (-) Transcript_41073:1165-1818(-)